MSSSTNGAATSSLPVPQRRLQFTHDLWMDSLGLPIHSGYYIEDLRALELGRWEERGCDAAFVQLEGQQGITETRVSEIAPGGTLPPLTFALDELVYVLDGRGLTTVWTSDDGPRKTFEWQKFSFDFVAPDYPTSGKIVQDNLGFTGPGTLWVDNLLVYDLSYAPFAVRPEAVQGTKRALNQWQRQSFGPIFEHALSLEFMRFPSGLYQ